MQMCLDLLAKRKLNAKKMVTHNFPLDKINEAFDCAGQGKPHAVFVALTI